ncbi:DUF1802 family protein [Deinococcus yavapaiensis]|uniref:DUF1802 family protein n=1 Tax=Deinococcus yavapaiensis KR-236 TaxID=694435 RepID=A0A318SHW8_9DEIO|nr:DUF1802 family protein [Deinococcus yavapaiensis]PYE53566.1 hypothetical protein DES52_10895 [Deinococcus yavapaiensis KR-236]
MPTAEYALKEWDVQVQALTRGDVALVLRKGGIMETHEGFEVEHRSFFLYPTFLHQNSAELRPDFTPLLRTDPSPGTVIFPALAEVMGVWRVEDLDRAMRLEDLQALDASAIERRFHYRNRPWLHALLLRVVKLDAPVALQETPEMLGCVSWVPLMEHIEVRGTAVPSDDRIDTLRVEIERRLT